MRPDERMVMSRVLLVLAQDLRDKGDLQHARRALEESISIDRAEISWDPELELIHTAEYSRLLAEGGMTDLSVLVDGEFINRAQQCLVRSTVAVQRLDPNVRGQRIQDIKRLAKLMEETILLHFGCGSDQHLLSIWLEASIHYYLGDPPSAIALANTGIEAAQANKDIFRREYTRLLTLLYQIQFGLGNYVETEKLIDRKMAVARNVFGEVSEQVACCHTDLARLFFVKGELINAEEEIGHAIEIGEQIGTISSEEHVRRHLLHIDIIRGLGDHARAIGACKKCLTVLETHYGDACPALPEVLVRMGESYHKVKKLDKAQESFLRCITLISVFGRPDAPAYRRALEGLGTIYGELGDGQKAALLRQNHGI